MGAFDALPDALVGALGEAVSVTPIDGDAREIVAIFKLASEMTLGGDVSLRKPMLRAKSTDVSDLADGATVEARDVTYRVRTLMPNGRGLTDIMLERTYG